MNDQDRITQLEASCAAMREALESSKIIVHEGFDESGSHYSGLCPLCKQINKALSTDAGKFLLDRLQSAESRLAEWETLRTNDVATHQNILRGIIALTRPQALHLAGAQDYDELKDRLQAVEKEREAHIATTNQMQSELAQALAERDRYKAAFQPVIDWMRSINTSDVSEFLGQLTALEMRKQLANLEALQPAKEQ